MVGHRTIVFTPHTNEFWPPENVTITHYISLANAWKAKYTKTNILQYINTNTHEQFLSDAHQKTLKSNCMNKDGAES
jgi:hypothetical protein